ncbi:MAG: hypothetical protein ACFFDL_15725 [Promethearchaeota archaeon]
MITKNKPQKYHIRKKFIKKYASQLGWKIRGTNIEPDFIENGNHFPIDLTFTGTKTNIHLKSQHFIRLSLVRCQNIVIDNCTISQLHIEGCTNIIIRNSRLLKVKQILSKGNTFENNVILQESYDRLTNDKYNKFIFTSMLVIAVFAVFFLVISILGFISSKYLWNSIMYLSSGIFAISISVYYFLTRIRMAKFPPNLYSNFNIVPFTDVNTYFAEVINLKQ